MKMQIYRLSGKQGMVHFAHPHGLLVIPIQKSHKIPQFELRALISPTVFQDNGLRIET